MSKAFLYLIFAAFLSLNVTGCSLFGSSDEDTETAEVSEEGDEFAQDEFGEDGDSESVEGLEGEEFDDGNEFAGEDGEPEGEDGLEDEDEYPDDDYADSGDEIGVDETEGLDDDDFAMGGDDEESISVDEGEIPSETLSSNEEQDLFANEAPAEESYSEYEPVETVASVSNLVSVKKMKPSAFSRAGANVNRLYVVRDGEDMTSVAQKIYGSDRSSDLLSWNGHFAGKSLKPGDKIYFSSPGNPNDPEMKTFYEDRNIAPQFYTTKRGENIRTIATKLLGNERSWMELYATNLDVTSKWGLPEGTQLRYWDGSQMGQSMAAAEPQSQGDSASDDIDMGAEEDFDEDLDDMNDDGGGDMAANDSGPDEVGGESFDDLDEPEEDMSQPPGAAGSTTIAPPPPPPMAAKPSIAPPPPPPPLKRGNSFGNKFANKMNGGKKAAMKGQEDSMIMGALGGLLILAAVILLIFIRRSRAKRVNFTQTQV